MQCRVLEASVAGFHEHFVRHASAALRRHLSDDALLVHIKAIPRDTVRVAEGGPTARAALRYRPASQGSNHRLAALVQPDSAAVDADLRQPDEVRARLDCQATKASQFVTRLWGTDSRDKVRSAIPGNNI